MGKFTQNPIVIINKKKIVDTIPLKIDIGEKDFILEIKDLSGKCFYKDKFCKNTFIKINDATGRIIVNYYDMKEKLILSDTIDLCNQNEKQIERAKEEIYFIVKREMDFPKGSDMEKEYHTKMIKICTTDKDARNYVENKIKNIIINNSRGMGKEKVNSLTSEIYATLYGMGALQELDDNPEVGEIMVNGFVYPEFYSDIYYIDRSGKHKYHKGFSSLDELKNVFSRAIAFSNKELNSVDNAIIEATRSNRDRVNVIIPDASESYVLNIRKFSNFVPSLENMKGYGTVDEYIDNLMNVLVKGKANIGIGGEMGTGKTSFINYLLTYTEPIERKVVIASISEIDIERVLKGHDIVLLNVDGTKGFTFENLIRTALRTTASRIIIPESRGEEFKQVYEASLKTKGNMFTVHALSDSSFLDICVDMYLDSNEGSFGNIEFIKNKISKSIDIIIIMKKVGNQIRVKSISEVVLDEKNNFKEMNLLYYWWHDPNDPLKGCYKRTNNRLTDNCKNKLNEYGVSMDMMKDL
jgi:pilus assembly protein CpaF